MPQIDGVEPRHERDGVTLSIVVPTKNRAAALGVLCRSILAQDTVPEELIIVDQSATDDGVLETKKAIGQAPASVAATMHLRYVRDAALKGANAARNVGLDMAQGDVVLFLDDDMELEDGCLRELMTVYEDPRVGGVSAAVVNYERPGPAFLWWSRTFMRGVFKDDRQPVYWAARERRGGQPVVVSRFGAGAMSFRVAVVGSTRFDGSVGGVCPGEDVDFCQRLAPGTKLVIAPNARVAHRYSEMGRDHRRHRLKEFVQGNHYVYRRNWQGSLYNRVCFLWFNVGCVVWAGVSAMVRRNGEAWRVTCAGMREAGRITVDREENG